MSNTPNSNVSASFDYCFWAKMIIAIPAIPLISVLLATFYAEPAWQYIIASYSGAVIVILAQKLDRLPFFARSITETLPGSGENIEF